MRKVLFTCSVILMLIPAWNNTNAQCCGAEWWLQQMVQSGIYGGYGIKYYNPKGFNNYIDAYNQIHASTLKTKMDNFGTAMGFKVGANLAQARFDRFLVGIKVDYHQTNEKHSATADVTPGVRATREFDLTLRTFGAGLSATYLLTENLHLKFLELMMTWNSGKLINKYSDPATSKEEKLSTDEASLGYSAGTGLIFYLLPPYVAIEGTVGYSSFSNEKMQFENSGPYLTQLPNGGDIMTNFVESGGLFGFVQLNLAFPL